jgi:cell division septum initiation protein DivIVA
MADRKHSRADAVRSAVDDVFSAAAGQAQSTAQSTAHSARGRAQEIVDEAARAAGRVVGAIDDLRPPTAEEVRALRRAVADLSARVAALERSDR